MTPPPAPPPPPEWTPPPSPWAAPPPPPPPAKPARAALVLIAVVVAVLLVVGAAAGIYLVSDDDDTPSASRGAPTTTPTSEPSSAAPEPEPNPDEPEYIREIREQVAEVRGLEWKAPLKLEVIPKAELAQRVRNIVARDSHPDRVAGDGETLRLMGAIPEDLDFAKAIDDLLAEQVLGFYDPETKELVVGDSGGGDVSVTTKISIAHELDHALTDQHFDFGTATETLDQQDKAEELAGYSGLIEGDAVTLQFRWAQRYLSEEEQVAALFGGGEEADTSVLERTPPFMRESLLFPYTHGAAFAAELSDGGSFRGINDAYRRPPISTEQILHPETYRAGEGASPPELPDVAAATGCSPVRRNVIGEFAMLTILKEEIGQATAEEGTEGWNGDVFETVRCDSTYGMVDRWRVDDDGCAECFEAALAEWVAEWSGSGQRPGGDGTFAGPRGAGRIARAGSVVELILARDGATAERIKAAVGAPA